MKKEDLLKLGLTEEQSTKILEVMAENLKGFIPKARFDEVNEAKKQLDNQVKERDKQLNDLKKSTGDIESLKVKIEELQTTNKTEKVTYEKNLKDLQFTNAIKLAIADKAQDIDLVSGLFDKSKMILGDDGKITGLDDQLKTLQESKAFLFKTTNKPGYNPNSGNPSLNNPFAKETFNLTEQGKIYKENPAQAKTLAQAAGIEF